MRDSFFEAILLGLLGLITLIATSTSVLCGMLLSYLKHASVSDNISTGFAFGLAGGICWILGLLILWSQCELYTFGLYLQMIAVIFWIILLARAPWNPGQSISQTSIAIWRAVHILGVLDLCTFGLLLSVLIAIIFGWFDEPRNRASSNPVLNSVAGISNNTATDVERQLGRNQRQGSATIQPSPATDNSLSKVPTELRLQDGAG